MGNIMIVGDTPKIIDLDDHLTHTCIFSNAIYNITSTIRLNEIILDLFHENEYKYYNEIYDLIDKPIIKSSLQSSWINKLYKEREKINDYLIIDKNSNIQEIKAILEKKLVRVLLLTDKKNIYNYSIINDLYKFRKEGIPIYDLIEEDITKYLEDYPTHEKILLKTQ